MYNSSCKGVIYMNFDKVIINSICDMLISSRVFDCDGALAGQDTENEKK